MRILILSNFYPPARAGGYTQWCHEVAVRLAERNHTVAVLTSRHELPRAQAGERNVYRLLYLDSNLHYYQPLHFFLKWRSEYRKNLATLDRIVSDFAPDVLFVWGMWALNKALPARAEQLLPGRVAYYLSDFWPAGVDTHTRYWQSSGQHWFTRKPKGVLSKAALAVLAEARPPALKFERALCVSARVRDLLIDAGLPLHHARVVHGGTDVERFSKAHPRDFRRRPLQLLYAGQLARHKGVHTAIEAMAMLVHQRRIHEIRLTLVGSGHPDYEAHLRKLVKKENLQAYVFFLGLVGKDMMPHVMQSHEVLVFPSIYEEPLARVTQEAMAAGMLVVGTTTGGSREILKEGETGLTFPPDDPQALAEQLAHAINSPDFCDRVAREGQRIVLEHFTLDRMVNEIDSYLVECFSGVACQAVAHDRAD